MEGVNEILQRFTANIKLPEDSRTTDKWDDEDIKSQCFPQVWLGRNALTVTICQGQLLEKYGAVGWQTSFGRVFWDCPLQGLQVWIVYEMPFV